MKNLLAVAVLFSFLLSGCHEGVFHWITPEPGDVVVEATATPEEPAEPEVIPEEEVGEVLPDPTPVPPCVVVKGNISTNTGEKIYHVPGQANYENVKIDEAAGERFFCSEEEAIAAGWRKALR